MISILEYENREKLVRLKEIENGKRNEEIDEFFYGKKMPSSFHIQMNTSPWMNRFILEDGYIVVPKNTNYNDDIEVATDSRFIVLKAENGKVASLSEDEIDIINQRLLKAVTPEEKIRFRKKREESRYYGTMYQRYRSIYSHLSDDVIERLRDALQKEPEKCEKWANTIDAASEMSVESTTRFFDYVRTSGESEEVLLGLLLADTAGRCIKNDGSLSLSYALADTKLTEQLIRALDPESIRIYRSFSEKD